MMWEEHTGHDVTSAFVGITTPVKELYDEIHQRGWTVQKVKTKEHAFHATAKNPHGEKLEAVGTTEATAVGNLLTKVMRREHIRSSAQHKIGMWDTTFEHQQQEIAQAYAEAPAYDPKAASAWIELARDSMRRADILKTQLHVEIVDEPQPYKTADELREDVKKKQHIYVSRGYAHHPVWSVDQMVAYRLVHDVLGHCVGGADWGWHGENRAFAAHAPLVSGMAQKALFTESLGQTAFMSVYHSWGPQKIAFLDELIEKVQEKENKPGHSGVHPSQSLAPGEVPTFGVESSVTPVVDPNHGWSAAVDPLPDNAYLWQREPTTGTDPLDIDGAMEYAHKIDPRLAQMPEPLAKQAVVNAFRSAFLAPRKNMMNGAIHYQHTMGIPADVDDPMVYWDTLEKQRANHNHARGLGSDFHLPFQQELGQFQRWVKSMHPRMDDEDVHNEAKRQLFHMLQEEEERIVAEDPGEQIPAEQVEATAYENLAKRLKVFTKPRIDDKHDFGDSTLFKRAHYGPYGSYLASHLRPLSHVSRHATTLAQTAQEDMHQHKGAGHHFRAQALNLGIPGMSPKIASMAWLHLNPKGSQLATLDPHVMEALGHDYATDMNDRDYFKYERELAAGRDAAGYGHVPLGPFTWGLYDHKTGGPGHHQDRSPLRVFNPTPHEQVDWNANVPPQQGWSSPYWWESTQAARDQVAQDWDDHIAINHPKGAVPFQPRTGSSSATPYFTHPQSGQEIAGQPGMSLMQHIKQTMGHTNVHDVWAGNYTVAKR